MLVSHAKNDIRKQFDLCKNTSAALVHVFPGQGPKKLLIQKSHQLMLNGNASASTSREETQLMANNLNSEVLRKELADPISHDQYVRLKTKIRNAIMQIEDNEERRKNVQNQQQEEQIETNQQEESQVSLPSVRNRRRPSRYIPWAPPLFKKSKNREEEEEKKGGKRKRGRPKKKKHYQPKKIVTKSEALKQFEVMTARFGMGNIPSVVCRIPFIFIYFLFSEYGHIRISTATWGPSPL